MSVDATRVRWKHLRERLHEEAEADKCPQRAVLELSKRYESASPSERRIVDAILAEWVTSEDENVRFDALAVIYDHRVQSALPALQELALRLGQSRAVGAPFELAKVLRVVEKVAGSNSTLN